MCRRRPLLAPHRKGEGKTTVSGHDTRGPEVGQRKTSGCSETRRARVRGRCQWRCSRHHPLPFLPSLHAYSTRALRGPFYCMRTVQSFARPFCTGSPTVPRPFTVRALPKLQDLHQSGLRIAPLSRGPSKLCWLVGWLACLHRACPNGNAVRLAVGWASPSLRVVVVM